MMPTEPEEEREPEATAAEEEAAPETPSEAAGEQPAEQAPAEEHAPEEEQAAVEEEAPAGTPETEAAGAEAGAEEAAGREAVEGALNVYDTLRVIVGLLGEQAWIHLGLHLAPGAQETKTDLAQARVAIDTLEMVGQQLRAHLDEEERRSLDNMLSTLRLNFVRKVG